MARHQLTGGGGIAFQRSDVGDWVALLSKGFTQRHHQSTHFSFFRGPPSVFFSITPVCLGLKDKNKKGVGVLRGRLGGTFVQGIHSTSSSINPLLFFSRPRRRRRRHRVTAAIESPLPSTHRHSVRWQTPDDERRVVALSPPSGKTFC